MNNIQLIKDFYNIDDFTHDILNWSFNSDFSNTEITIGHPKTSHKGLSLGDILPYTRLPYELKSKYPTLKVYVPEWFSKVFEHNPYIDGVKSSNTCCRWGSLGPFGTTVQRTCNVWGIQTHFTTPIVYTSQSWIKTENKFIVCTRSKTGGRVKNLNYLQSEILKLKPKYRLIQVGMKDDDIIPNLDEYYFNLSYDRLIEIFSKSKGYIGVQNSLYHLAKSLNLKIVGILPENVDPFFVKLPLLTQCNHLEIEMLPFSTTKRVYSWINKIKSLNKNPDESHHIGWLYPDTPHLTMNLTSSTQFCPMVSYENIVKGLNDEIYPFNNPENYDYYTHADKWA